MVSGCVSRITTGAPLPRGADAVVQVEDTVLVEGEGDEENVVRILVGVASGKDVRRVGVDIALGEELLPKGTVLGPPELGLLATLGFTEVNIVTPPTVAILSTGNEVRQRTPINCWPHPLTVSHIHPLFRSLVRGMC